MKKMAVELAATEALMAEKVVASLAVNLHDLSGREDGE